MVHIHLGRAARGRARKTNAKKAEREGNVEGGSEGGEGSEKGREEGRSKICGFGGFGLGRTGGAWAAVLVVRTVGRHSPGPDFRFFNCDHDDVL